MCPNSLETPLYKRNFQGLCLPKRIPQPRPNRAPFEKPAIDFAYTRTVVCAYANGYLAYANGCRIGIQSLRQRHLYRVRSGLVPYKELSEQGKEGI